VGIGQRDIDSAGHDEILLAGHDPHGGQGDGLLTRSAVAAHHQARCSHRPPGRQCRQAADAVGFSDRNPGSDHDVIDLGRIEPDPGGQFRQALAQQILGMERMQRAVGLALASRRADTVDDPRLDHTQPFRSFINRG
jgi:hypothetical protein